MLVLTRRCLNGLSKNCCLQKLRDSTFYDEYSQIPKEEIKRYKIKWMAPMAKLSPRGARSRPATMYKWRDLCRNRGMQKVFWPPPQILAEWLQERSSAGPTVPQGHMAALAWWNRALGAQFPIGSLMLDHLRKPPQSHNPKQQEPFTIMEAAHWEELFLATNNIYVKNVINAILVITYGAVRHKHTKILSLVGLGDEVLVDV